MTFKVTKQDWCKCASWQEAWESFADHENFTFCPCCGKSLVKEIDPFAKPKPKKRGPKGGFQKKTLEKVEEVCFRYYLSPSNMSQICRATGLSAQTIDKILRHFGKKYRKGNAKAIAQYRGLPE